MADETAKAAWVKRVLGLDIPGIDVDEHMRQAWEAAYAELEPAMIHALRTGPTNAGDIRIARDYALGKAEAGDYAAALTSLHKLRFLLDAAQGDQAPTHDLVAKRKFLLERWRAIPAEINVPIQGLVAKIETTLPHEDAKMFCSSVSQWFSDRLEKFQTEFEAAIDSSINSGDAKYSAVASAAETFKGRLGTDEVLVLMKQEAFFDGDLIEGAFHSAMDEIETALTA